MMMHQQQQIKAILLPWYCVLILVLASSVHSFLPSVNLMRSSNTRSSSINRLRAMEVSSSTTSTVVTPAPQLLQFQEPLTNVTVVLVGSMHYNPTSIRLASQTVQQLGQQNRLGSVLIESCDLRWNKTLELYATKPFLKSILGNEMRAAQEQAFAFNQPVVLGDQRINITTAAMKESFKQTILDLVTPPSGWRRFKEEFDDAWEDAVPNGDSQYLSPLAFFDPRLLLALPVSLVKYPLSFLVRDPLPTSIFFAVFFGLSFVTTGGVSAADDYGSLATAVDNTEFTTYTLIEVVGNLFFALLETVVFARLLLKPLLADRNVILAENILQQCKIYETTNGNTKSNTVTTPGGGVGGWFGFLTGNTGTKTTGGGGTTAPSIPMDDIIYAPGSVLDNIQGDDANGDGNEKVVVAVLGMAHLNGVMKLLKEQKV